MPDKTDKMPHIPSYNYVHVGVVLVGSQEYSESYLTVIFFFLTKCSSIFLYIFFLDLLLITLILAVALFG